MALRNHDQDDSPGSPETPDQTPSRDEAVPLELDGVLDLHQFLPAEVKQLVPDWLEECRRAGILDVRIIHGKGVGVLRTIVRKILAEHAAVDSFGQPSDASSWGATVVRLLPPD